MAAEKNPFLDPNYGLEPEQKAAANPFLDPNYGKETDGPLARGFNKAGQSMKMTAQLAGGDTEGVAQTVKDAADYAQANPSRPEGQKLMEAWDKGDGVLGGIGNVARQVKSDYDEAKGFIPGMKAVGRDLRAMGEGIVEQVPNMIAPTVGMVGGAAAGSPAGGPAGAVAGGWVGASAGNALVEGGDQIQTAIQKAGIDPRDTAAVRAYLDANGDQLLKQTAIKGGVIGAVDTATAGLAHFLLTGPGKAAAGRALSEMGVDVADKAAVKTATQSDEFAKIIANDAAYQASKQGVGNVARNATAAGLEPAGEFAGEYLGQGLASGDWDTKNAALEALSSVGQSGAMFAGQKAWQYATSPAQAKAEPGQAPGSGPNQAPTASPATPPPLALPAPTYTGTPSDQVLQAEAERQNQVAEAQARADELYRRRDEVDAARQPQEAGPDFSPVRDAYAAQLEALRQQEAGQPDVPQTAPPDGRAILEARRNAEIAAGRAEASPDDEILQSIGAAEPPHRAMGIDPNAGPLSAGAAIAVDTGVHGQMQAAAQQAAQVEQPGAKPAAGPLQSAAPQSTEATPAQRWASMSADERASIAGQIGLPPVIARNIPRAGWEALNPDLQGRLSSAMAPAASTSSTIPNASAGNGWAAFGPESGTVGVPRAQMPQIKAEHRGAMVNFMNARGVSHQEETLPASSLKPTQAEFSPEKVARAKSREGGDRAILVSADNHVLDGHHQWLAAKEKGEDVRAIRLNAPIRDLVGLAHEFPSSTISAASEAPPQRLGDRGRAAEEADTLRAMAQDAGWAERGGLLIRDTAGNATGRTKWLPRAEWFMSGMEADPETLARDIDRFVAGEKVPARSRRTIEGMLEWLDAQRTGQPLNEDSSAAEWERVGYNEASPEEQVAFDAIEAFIDSAPQLSEEDALMALGFTKDEIRAEIEGTAGKGGVGEADAGAAQERAADDRQGPQDQAGGTFLEGYSAAELAARDEAQRLADDARAKAEKAADDKARADAERDTFTLTGSDRAADVQAAQGQGGLFDQPAPAANRNGAPEQVEPTPAKASKSGPVERDATPQDVESAPATSSNATSQSTTPAERWDVMNAEQRAEVLMQPGGWATASGSLNQIGKRIAGQDMAQMAPMTRETVERLMGKALARDFSLRPVEIMESLIDAGNIKALHKAAGVRSADAFGGLALDDQANAYAKYVMDGGLPAPDTTERYNDRVRRQEREATIRRLQEDSTITQANGKPFKTEASAGAFSSANDLGDTHEAVAVPGGFVLKKLPRARRPSAIAAQQARRAADPEAQRQDAAFARAEKVGPAAQQAVADYEDGKTSIAEFEAALEAAATTAVGEAPSPLEALFSDLNSDSTRKANKARRAAAKLPQAERIDYVQANFHDILIRLMEAGALEVNGTSTLNEDNKQCL